MKESPRHAPVARPHSYPDPDSTCDCAHGCGCWVGPFRSGGPKGVDPFGSCPKAPEPVPASCPNCGYPDCFDGTYFKGIFVPGQPCPHCTPGPAWLRRLWSSDAPEGLRWECPDCHTWATLGGNAAFHVTQTGHGEPTLIAISVAADSAPSLAASKPESAGAWEYGRPAPEAHVVEAALAWPGGFRDAVRGYREHGRWYAADGHLWGGEPQCYAWRERQAPPPLEPAPPPSRPSLSAGDALAREEVLDGLREAREIFGDSDLVAPAAFVDEGLPLIVRAIAYLEGCDPRKSYAAGFVDGFDTAKGKRESSATARPAPLLAYRIELCEHEGEPDFELLKLDPGEDANGAMVPRDDVAALLTHLAQSPDAEARMALEGLMGPEDESAPESQPTPNDIPEEH